MSHVCEALIEQSNYFKVVHGSAVTAPQPLSSKHTLTRGDKIDSNVKSDKETKYECLARLINSTQAQCDTINVNAPSRDKSADISSLTKHPPTIITTTEEAELEYAPRKRATATNKTDESSFDDGHKQQNATVVTTYGNSDNNNQNDANEAQCTTTDERRIKDLCELKIVERNEQGQQTTAGTMEQHADNADTSLAADATDRIYIDLHIRTNLDNNNSTIESRATNDQEAESGLESVELATQPLPHPQKIDVGQDLIESDGNASIQQKQQQLLRIQHHTTTTSTTTTTTTTNIDRQLDINENKSDMKLNYAEVVKMDSPMETQMYEDKSFTIGDDACGGNGRSATFQNCLTNVQSDLEPKVQVSANINTCADVATDGRPIECTTQPKAIQKPSSINCRGSGTEPYEEMSPICKVRLPLNSPRFTKSKDITNELPLTPDSSHSLDNSCELSAPFEPNKKYNAPIVPVSNYDVTYSIYSSSVSTLHSN